MKFFYDLHIHSCLSPCGSNDMTPNNIVNMAALLGQDIIALTDHNSAKNCRAAAEAAEELDLLFVPGMELCTSEEAHIVCLFPTVDAAEQFDELIWKTAMKIPNDKEKLGDQIIMNSADEPVGEFDYMLTLGSDISVDDVVKKTALFGGVAYPAHIDRASYSVISTLGAFPYWSGFAACEITKNGDIEVLCDDYPEIKNLPHILSSDAHYLENMNERGAWIDLPERSVSALLDALGGEIAARFGRTITD
ncbi:MAG: PHP domain-containing protein [Oscillospiraceae bacterium]|jgi:PHP family Zn ribbon phosphoesterase|nr:PHP domain-containing protein [Oscillospiraceae bacterium]